jgi:hypothetical protein
MRARRLIIGLVLLGLTPPALAAAAAPAPPVPPVPPVAPIRTAPKRLLARAHLQGLYGVSGVVTRANNVPGERKGQLVTWIWGFPASCPGQCRRIVLVRQRAGGKDTVVLHRRKPAYYSGTGSFNAPVLCDGRLHKNGERANFTITLRITGGVVQGNLVEATSFTATYNNPDRVALTRCVTLRSSDAAHYVGTPPAEGVTFRVPSRRSSTGS